MSLFRLCNEGQNGWNEKTNKLRGYQSASGLYQLMTAAAGEVVSNFAGRVCCEVSATDPYDR
jgi:hypothetical protein